MTIEKILEILCEIIDKQVERYLCKINTQKIVFYILVIKMHSSKIKKLRKQFKLK